MREAAEFSLDDAAPRLDKTRSALHRMETGETRVDVHMVRSMMDLYDIYDPDLIEEAREAYKPPWYRAYGDLGLGYVDVETSAAQVDNFEVQLVPGLLQTEQYMRAVFGHWEPSAADNDTAVRLMRQRRLMGEGQPLRLNTVIDEAVLRCDIAGPRPEAMLKQFRHLLAAAALPTVNLQILPFRRAARCLTGPFNILTFPDQEDPAILYVEHVAGAIHIDDPGDVAKAKLEFSLLQAEALTPAASITLIEQVVEDLKDVEQ